MKMRKLCACLQIALGSALMAGAVTPWPALANPKNPSIVLGTATFARPDGNTLLVRNSNGALINWQSFSIGLRETTRFEQTSASSVVFNKVTGGEISSIFGHLQSNGRVFLINPSGIVFGRDARVDVAGLVASSLNISDADLAAGRLRFSGGLRAGKVVNEGLIRSSAGGHVVLVGRNVENRGIIESPEGKVLLVAGGKAHLGGLDPDAVSFEVNAPSDSVLNLGRIEAAGGAVGVFAGTLRHSGEIRADGLGVDGAGRVVLRARNDLRLEDGSLVSASAAHGGGSVQVRAKNIELASGAQISADATREGDGGRVILFADQVGLMHGQITARGGAEGGDGGFVETSAGILDVAGLKLDLKAPKGEGGQWLIDPYNISIVAGAVISGCAGPTTFKVFCSNSQIGADLIMDQLNAGTSVSISTSGDGHGTDPGAIHIGSAIAKTAGANASLSFSASAGITVAAPITSTAGTLNTTLSGGSGAVAVGAAIDTNGGSFSASTSGSFANSAPISTGGGSFSVNASGGSTLGNSINAGLGTVNLNGSSATVTGALTGGAFNTSLYGAGGFNIAAGGSVASNSGNVSIVADAVDLAGNLAGTGQVSFQPYTWWHSVELGAEVAGRLSLTSAELNRVTTGPASGIRVYQGYYAGNINIGGAIAPTGTNILWLDSQNTVTQSPGATIAVDSLRLTASGNVTLTEANSLSTVAGFASYTSLHSVLPLTVGTVMGHTGLSTDGLTLTAPSITFSQASTIDDNLILNTNDLTVAAAVTAASQITIQRTSAGDIDLGSKPGGGVLGLDAADIANLSAPSMLIGGANVGTTTVSAAVAADVGHLTVKAGQFDVAGGGSLSNTGHLSVLADDADLAGTLSSTGADVLLAPRTAGRAVEVGTAGPCASTLCLDATELSHVSSGGTGWLKLGDALSGGLTVVSGTSIGGARLALTGSGILIDSGADISLSDALSLKADDLSIDPSAALAATNTIEILRRSVGDMDLGTKPGGGVLGLTTGELNRLFTDKLVVGDLNTVNLTVSQLLTTGAGEAFENVTGNLALAGRNQVFNASVLPAADLLLVGSQGITVNGLETIGSGAASSTLTIRHFNSASGDIELGSFCGGGALCVDTATLAKLTPGANTTLRVEGGTLHINDDIAPSATNVVLQGGDADNYGLISADASITATNLAAVGANGVSLTFANNIAGSFAASSLYGNIAFTNAAGSVTIGTVAGISGVRANTSYGGGSVSLTADDLNVTQPIEALGSGGTVQIDRYTPGNVDLGGGTGPGLKLASAEMNFISTETLRLGQAGTINAVDVTAPLNGGLALANITNFSVRANSFNIPNAIATTGFLEFIRSIGSADMTLTQQLNGNTVYLALGNLAISGLGGIAGTISVDIAASAAVDLGGADVAGTTLGLTPAELSTISSPRLGISAGSGAFNVTAPVTYGAGALAFQSHGPLNINQPVNVTAGELQMMADSMNINAAVSASGRVWISHITGSTDVDLGTKTGGKLGLTATELNRITTPDLEFQGNDVAVTALLDKSAGGALEHVGNLAIGSESINVAAGGIDAGAGDVRFSANSMNVSAPVTTTGNVLLSVQSGGRNVTLGSEVGGQLSLTDAELDRFTTPSLSIQGYGIQIAAPLSFAPGNLPLVALKALSTSINQSAGATVSASNLALTAISGVSMGEANAVDTLAGSTTGYNASFSFNNGATPLTIGSVATETGIHQTYYYGSLTLTANDLTIAQPVVSNTYGSIVINADTLAIGASVTSSGANTTIRPLTAGREIDFGTETAGKLSLTSAELGFVSANNFYLGGTTTGNVTVSAATTAPGTVQVTSGGILAVNAPFTATNLTFVADDMDIGALVTASGKTVTPMTAGREIDLGSETAGRLSLTAAEVANFNAGGNLVIGNSSSGNIHISAPIAWSGPNLRLMTAQGVGDANASGIDITTPYLEIYRGTGVGAGNALETALNNLYVDAGAGDVLVNNTSGSLGVQVGTTTGSIAISNTGSLNTSGSMAASGGSISLTGSSVNQGGNLSADIAVDVTATAGAINMGTRSTTAPSIHYRASGNITVGVLTGTTVTVDSGADINDANGDWTRDVVADSATLVAAGNLDIDVRAPAQSISVGGTATVRDMSCSTVPLPVEAPPVDICTLDPTLCAAPPPPSVAPAVSLAPPAEEDKKRRLKQCR